MKLFDSSNKKKRYTRFACVTLKSTLLKLVITKKIRQKVRNTSFGSEFIFQSPFLSFSGKRFRFFYAETDYSDLALLG